MFGASRNDEKINGDKKMKEYINGEELTEFFTDNSGSVSFAENLKKTQESEGDLADKQFIYLLSQFVDFNNCFAAAQTNLSSRIANCDFLVDDSEIEVTSDRAAEVAKLVFYAAIDEFADVPHRTMSHFTLKAIANSFDFDKDEINKITKPSEFLKEIKAAGHKGYGLSADSELDYKTILFNIGVHIGTEGTASSEFLRLLEFIEGSYPKLAAKLKGDTVGIEDDALSKEMAAKLAVGAVKYMAHDFDAIIDLEDDKFKLIGAASDTLAKTIDVAGKRADLMKGLDGDKAYLRASIAKAKLNLGGKGISNFISKNDTMGGMDWIRLHTTVDQDHFEKAVVAANMAIEYGPRDVLSVEDAKKEVLRGIDYLSNDIQLKFYNGIASQMDSAVKAEHK